MQAASMVLCMGLKKGFTVIELVIVIAIGGILTMIAVPAFQDWMTHSAVNNATAMVVSKLKQARNMAVAENRNITLSFNLAGTTVVGSTFNYDIKVYAPKQPEVIDLKQFSKSLIFRKNTGKNLTFESSGQITGKTTMKILKGNYYQCITVNLIGRCYVSTMASATPTCQVL
ncbi:MAG: prepilin-type N-terminal cleavage/methylation domain-containing protein [Mariprofundaceae bacterium]|nr:prepilin-type N-terminal cleavage/methylation domain-containing protein [Mariprofundaceae bacterium]